jgi:hypothetical protein
MDQVAKASLSRPKGKAPGPGDMDLLEGETALLSVKANDVHRCRCPLECAGDAGAIAQVGGHKLQPSPGAGKILKLAGDHPNPVACGEKAGRNGTAEETATTEEGHQIAAHLLLLQNTQDQRRLLKSLSASSKSAGLSTSIAASA